MEPIFPSLLISPWVWDVGVILVGKSLIIDFVILLLAWIAPPVPVVIIFPLAVPILPSLLKLPCVWLIGVLASLNLLSSLKTNSLEPSPSFVKSLVFVGILAVVAYVFVSIVPSFLTSPAVCDLLIFPSKESLTSFSDG